MRNKFFSILAIAAVLSEAACTKDYPILKVISFTGVTDSSSTRTELSPVSDGYNLNWAEGDLISVVDPSGKALTYAAVTGGSSVTAFNPYDPSGSFVPENMDVDNLGSLSFPTKAPELGSYRAYYPASISKGVLPSVQDFVDGNIHCVPMVAVNSSEPTTFNFKQTGGILKLCIKTAVEGVKVRSIILSADQGLSGSYLMNNDEAVVSGTDGVTLDCGVDGVAIGLAAVPFHIAVPANVYSGLAIRIITTDGRMSVISLKEKEKYSVKRAELRAINVAVSNFTTAEWTGVKAVLMQGPDFNETLKKLTGQVVQQAEANYTIKEIVFKTGVHTAGKVRMDDPSSDIPVYADFDKNTGIATVWTSANVIHSGSSASAMFDNMKALESVVNLSVLNTSAALTFYRMFYGCSAMTSLDVSSLSTASLVDARNMFYGMTSCEKLDFSSLDVTRLATARSLDYMFYNMPKLKEIRFGEKGEHSGSFRPSGLFCTSDDTFSTRTGSYYGSITLYCTKLGASWLADTQLRWIKSGYSGKSKIDVKFLDYRDITIEYNPAWASN